MNEIWKDIRGYEGLYQVSNLGKVKGLARVTCRNHKIKERILKETHYKYAQVSLWKEGKERKVYIHRLVALAFIENPNNFPEVNHKDENTFNNCVDNLEWCTSKYNANYGNRTEKCIGFKRKPVIKVETGEVYISAAEASRLCNLNYCVLVNACNKRHGIKTCGGFHWEYI